MATINVRVGEEAHAAWMAHCERHGLVSAEEIRQFIECQASEPGKPMRPKAQRKIQKKVKISLWLTESEIAGIMLRTTLNGGTRAAWIIKVVRAALTRQPVFDDAETVALTEATAELNAIGKNLNQIARRLNEKQQAEQALDVASIRATITDYTNTIQALVEVNRSRWDIRA